MRLLRSLPYDDHYEQNKLEKSWGIAINVIFHFFHHVKPEVLVLYGVIFPFLFIMRKLPFLSPSNNRISVSTQKISICSVVQPFLFSTCVFLAGQRNKYLRDSALLSFFSEIIAYPVFLFRNKYLCLPCWVDVTKRS